MSPWGKIDNTINYCRGFSFVSTPRHGGYRITDRVLRNHAICPDEIIKLGARTINDYHFFEEDCNWALLLFDCPKLLQLVAKSNAKDENELFNQCKKSVEHWHKDYFNDPVPGPVTT